ncbi:MAG TPA: hypothetical protein VGM52_19230 [Herbaspirillum sp.]|jgi:hypothetical protein
MTAAAHLIGTPAVAQRLFSSLQVDIYAARALRGWQPPLTVDQGMSQTAK